MEENKKTPASTEEAKPEKKGINFKIDKKILLIGIAALLVIATVVTVCIILANKAKNGGGNNTPPTELTSVDILDGDLSDYISIDAKYYKGYQVVIDNRITDMLVNSEIIQARYKHRGSDPIENGDGIISVGDEVNIFYKGYYLDGENKVYFNGGSNVGGKAYTLGIGSGGFIPGFECNLIGKNPADYSADNPMIIATYFPRGYQEPTLAGKIAYFEVTVEVKDGKYQIKEYDVPAFDDAFVTEKLEMTEGKLSSFEGATLAEKYVAYVRNEIVKNGEMNQDDLALDAFWESVLAGAVVKKYPEKQLQQAYDDKLEEIIAYYNYYYSNYYTLEEFGCRYFGLSAGSDWRAEITKIAEEEIKQQLVFYHIMNLEGLKPTQLEYERRFDEYLVAALDEEGKTPDKFKTEEEYEAMKESKKAELIELRSEEYFKAMIYYEIGIEAIIDYAEIVEING